MADRTLLGGPAGPVDAWLRQELLEREGEGRARAVFLLFGAGVAARWMLATGEALPVAAELIQAVVPQLDGADTEVLEALGALAAGQPEAWARRCPY